MKPSDLGLPDKFPSWRKIDFKRTQYDAVIAAACSDKRFVILNAPTGTGKSTIYMALAGLFSNQRVLILTQTKGLQDQLATDFSPMGLVQVKGQSNYACLYFEGERTHLPGCDEGPCHAGVDCQLKASGCHYYDAVRRAARSRLVVTNYSYWMNVQKHADRRALGDFDILILDEAHDAASSLADFVRIHIDRRKIYKLLDLETPHGASIEEWVEWAVHALKECRQLLEFSMAACSRDRSRVEVVRDLQEIEGEISDLVLAGAWKRVNTPDPPAWMPGTSTDWIIETDETKHSTVFQPVWASGYAEQYLFARIPKVVLVSATVTTKDASFLGIGTGDFDFQEYPSPFRKEIRPVYVVRTARVGRNMTTGEERMWMNRIDQIIQREAVDRKLKGIIHTQSYERAKLIFARSKFQHLLVIHDSRNTRDTVARFKRMAGPAVLLSPAVTTGYDFPAEEARFQIIAKVPFIDNRPAVIQARHKSDRQYLDYSAIVKLIQMAGRGVRSEKDWCRTFIIDDNFGDWFYPRNRKLFPKWFRSAVRQVGSLSEVR